MRFKFPIALWVLILNITLLAKPCLAQSSVIYTPDVPQSFKAYLEKSLQELFEIQGSGATALHGKIFKGISDGTIYRQWFHNRVRKISMTESCNVTAKIDSEGEPGVIYISRCVDLTPNADKKFYWLSILFHEARHLEPEHNHWKHGICVDTSGMANACDDSELGPFALEKVMSFNILKYCLNCSDTMKQQAQDVLDDNITWSKILPKALNALDQDMSPVSATSSDFPR